MKKGIFELHPQLAADCHHVTDLPLSRILLMNDSQFPWLIQVPMLADITEVLHLNAQQQQQMWQESQRLCKCLSQVFSPDKLNIAALGNMVPQLHIHHIARFTDDVAWPKPVWGQQAAKPYSAEQLNERLALLRDRLHT